MVHAQGSSATIRHACAERAQMRAVANARRMHCGASSTPLTQQAQQQPLVIQRQQLHQCSLTKLLLQAHNLPGRAAAAGAAPSPTAARRPAVRLLLQEEQAAIAQAGEQGATPHAE